VLVKVLAIEGGASHELLSFMGRVIVHDGTVKELEFLFPKGQVHFVEVVLEGGTLRDGRPTIWLREHPDMDTVTWPLDPADFVPLTGETREQAQRTIVAALRRRTP
jgi:hypothetical protein